MCLCFNTEKLSIWKRKLLSAEHKKKRRPVTRWRQKTSRRRCVCVILKNLVTLYCNSFTHWVVLTICFDFLLDYRLGVKGRCFEEPGAFVSFLSGMWCSERKKRLQPRPLYAPPTFSLCDLNPNWRTTGNTVRWSYLETGVDKPNTNTVPDAWRTSTHQTLFI